MLLLLVAVVATVSIISIVVVVALFLVAPLYVSAVVVLSIRSRGRSRRLAGNRMNQRSCEPSQVSSIGRDLNFDVNIFGQLERSRRRGCRSFLLLLLIVLLILRTSLLELLRTSLLCNLSCTFLLALGSSRTRFNSRTSFRIRFRLLLGHLLLALGSLLLLLLHRLLFLLLCCRLLLLVLAPRLLHKITCVCVCVCVCVGRWLKVWCT